MEKGDFGREFDAEDYPEFYLTSIRLELKNFWTFSFQCLYSLFWNMYGLFRKALFKGNQKPQPPSHVYVPSWNRVILIENSMGKIIPNFNLTQIHWNFKISEPLVIPRLIFIV